MAPKNNNKIAKPVQRQIKLRNGRKEEPQLDSMHPHTRKWVGAVLLYAIAVISILGLFNMAGSAGQMMDRVIHLLFGKIAFLFPIILIGLGSMLLSEKTVKVKTINYIGGLVFVLSLTGLMNLFVAPDQLFAVIDQGGAGGYLGLIFSYAFMNILGFWASIVLVIALAVIGLLLMINMSLDDLAESGSVLGRMVNWMQIHYYDWRYADKTDADRNEDDVTEVEEIEEVQKKPLTVVAESAEGFTTKSLKAEKKPTFPERGEKVEEPLLDEIKQKIKYKKIDVPLELLEMSSGKPSSGNIVKAKERIQKMLESFNIPVVMGEVHVGPTVTQYEMIPAEGIKLSRITALQDDLALALAAHPIRLEAPIPGKSAVGIEVPNISVAIVRLRELLESPAFKKRKSDLEMPLGKDVSGKAWSYSIEKAPHVLVAGSTGSGKSVCLNTIIVSLLYQNSPETLRFIMVDPKRVELTAYENLPHLLTPVVTDVKKTVNALKWAVAEMDRRYILLQKHGKKNISSYNETANEKMPFIVFIIDEMADLMSVSRNEVESLIIRLAQMARAVGIHLILATQRPSVDVITGLIKANVPTRIAFAVASSMDSRTILDTVGADKLVGKGDMLFSSPELAKPVRLQGAYLTDEEIKKVVDYWKNSGQLPDFDPTIINKSTSSSGGSDYNDSEDGDELFDEAQEIVIQMNKASTSLLQRKLKIGYSRAARLMDILEEAGIVGPADGARPREILVTSKEDAGRGFDVAEKEIQPVFDEEVEEREELARKNRIREQAIQDDNDMIPGGDNELVAISPEEANEIQKEVEEVIESQVDDEDEEEGDDTEVLSEDEEKFLEKVDELDTDSKNADDTDDTDEEEEEKPIRSKSGDDWAN